VKKKQTSGYYAATDKAPNTEMEMQRY